MFAFYHLNLHWSKESTTNIITSESLQNFYHDSRKRACPPKSHSFIDILPVIKFISTFLDFVVVKADGRDGVLLESTISDGLDKGGFTSILEADDGDL